MMNKYQEALDNLKGVQYTETDVLGDCTKIETIDEGGNVKEFSPIQAFKILTELVDKSTSNKIVAQIKVDTDEIWRKMKDEFGADLEEVKLLADKATPKYPIVKIDSKNITTFKCPTCNDKLVGTCTECFRKIKYCSECGQKFDTEWEAINE